MRCTIAFIKLLYFIWLLSSQCVCVFMAADCKTTRCELITSLCAFPLETNVSEVFCVSGALDAGVRVQYPVW